MTSRDPKGAVKRTVGYPSESLASCFILPRLLSTEIDIIADSSYNYTDIFV